MSTGLHPQFLRSCDFHGEPAFELESDGHKRVLGAVKKFIENGEASKTAANKNKLNLEQIARAIANTAVPAVESKKLPKKDQTPLKVVQSRKAKNAIVAIAPTRSQKPEKKVPSQI